MDTPELDLTLLGATGFVGRLTAAHLARFAPADARIGLAGRSTTRLDALLSELGAAAKGWVPIVLDVSDRDGLDALAARTRVLVSTVGPYVRHGLPVVTACAEHGTDYLDLTGETLFVARSIAAAHERATTSGARIIHACGFDSVPSDLGVGLTAAAAAADGAGVLTDTTLHVRSMRGGFSGGTIDSLRQQAVEIEADPSQRSLLADPTALAPGTRRAPRTRRRPWLARDTESRRWQVPFVMGGFNRQIVLRTADLRPGGYGSEFRYREVVDTATGPVGAVAAAGLAGFFGVLMGGMTSRRVRPILDRLLPKPGDGPSEKVRASGRFVVEIDAETSQGHRYRTTVSAQHDPGYDATAIMLGEAALSAAFDPGLPAEGGVLTPMTVFGEVLADRLRARGFRIETERLRS